jgi:hypothetical protein
MADSEIQDRPLVVLPQARCSRRQVGKQAPIPTKQLEHGEAGKRERNSATHAHLSPITRTSGALSLCPLLMWTHPVCTDSRFYDEYSYWDLSLREKS